MPSSNFDSIPQYSKNFEDFSGYDADPADLRFAKPCENVEGHRSAKEQENNETNP